MWSQHCLNVIYLYFIYYKIIISWCINRKLHNICFLHFKKLKITLTETQITWDWYSFHLFINCLKFCSSNVPQKKKWCSFADMSHSFKRNKILFHSTVYRLEFFWFISDILGRNSNTSDYCNLKLIQQYHPERWSAYPQIKTTSHPTRL